MGIKDDGGPECSRCGQPSARRQGRQFLCEKHYRFGQMRSTAKRDNKLVPSHEQLEAIAKGGTNCPDCSVRMNWLGVNGQGTVATLQHYRDGSLAIVCRSCNTRHAFMPRDTYRDMAKDCKRCSRCEVVKPLTEFSADNGRSGKMKFKSACKPCSDALVTNWKESNREKYNEYQRAYRAMRKASGSPVSSGS